MDQPQSEPNPKEREIFLEALDHPSPRARAAFLDGACREDLALRRKVEAMLADHFSADAFMAAHPNIQVDGTFAGGRTLAHGQTCR